MHDARAKRKRAARRRRRKAVINNRRRFNEASSVAAERATVRALIRLQQIKAGALRERVILGQIELMLRGAACDPVSFGCTGIAVPASEVPSNRGLPVQHQAACVEDGYIVEQ